MELKSLGWELLCSADVSGKTHRVQRRNTRGNSSSSHSKYYRENPHNWYFVKVEQSTTQYAPIENLSSKPPHYTKKEISDEEPPKYEEFENHF